LLLDNKALGIESYGFIYRDKGVHGNCEENNSSLLKKGTAVVREVVEYRTQNKTQNHLDNNS
jgi:hypothetical protein